MLINSSGGVKIADFGIGKKLGHHIPEGGTIAEEEEEEDDDRMTSTTVGTTKFMSPERLEGLPYNHTGDIWSLGLILAEFISGTQPMRKCRSEVRDRHTRALSRRPFQISPLPHPRAHSLRSSRFRCSRSCRAGLLARC